MAKLETKDVIASLKEMTILELNELIKAIEEEFGVSAAAPVAAAAAADRITAWERVDAKSCQSKGYYLRNWWGWQLVCRKFDT